MKQLFVLLAIIVFLAACRKNNSIVITASNELSIDRKQQTVGVTVSSLPSFLQSTKLNVKENDSGKILVSQLVDNDLDGNPDILLFQSDFSAGQEKSFTIEKNLSDTTSFKSLVYARFVPERLDDFAWENDRIAFRMYGPALQATGEISSGVDVWVKSVSKLVIDEWYKGDDYHVDHGEGLDAYKVGPSRGCGGLAIWRNDKMYASKNYTQWKIIANGPIRTVFELSYAPWDADGVTVSEKKRISLDAGQNLNHFQSTFVVSHSSETPAVAIGIVKREGDGSVRTDAQKHILRYWEPQTENGITGCAVVLPPAIPLQSKDTDDHYLLITNMIHNKVEYYAGACWNKNSMFPTLENWDAYLDTFAECLASPIKITVQN